MSKILVRAQQPLLGHGDHGLDAREPAVVVNQSSLGFLDVRNQTFDALLYEDYLPNRATQICPEAHCGKGNGQTSPDRITFSRSSARLRSSLSSRVLKRASTASSA